VELAMTDDANAPIDDHDLLVLSELRDLFDAVDPVPPTLTARIRFALELEDLDAEVSRLHESWGLVGAGTRGDGESRTVTYDSERLTIMVTLTPAGDGTFRVDGWLAPPAAHRVELRTGRTDGDGPGRLRVATVADDQGRFVLDGVPPGLAQLVVRGDGDLCVVTPSIVV
jgi:hypothetical protein